MNIKLFHVSWNSIICKVIFIEDEFVSLLGQPLKLHLEVHIPVKHMKQALALPLMPRTPELEV